MKKENEEFLYLLNKYREEFEDNYPLMELVETKKETIAHIKKCLKIGKKVKVKYSKDILY